MDTPVELPAPEFDEDGCVTDEAADTYVETVMEKFGASPEGVEVSESCDGLGWAAMLLDLGLRYLRVDAATMRVRDLEKLLFDIFPRKVSCEPESAAEIITELRAFWCFVKREWQPPFASECLALLARPGLPEGLRRELADPSNYGMAKSVVMQGQQAGFDMSNREDMAEFRTMFNAAAAPRIGPPGVEPRDGGDRGRRPTADARKAERKKQKAQRRARKRNR